MSKHKQTWFVIAGVLAGIGGILGFAGAPMWGVFIAASLSMLAIIVLAAALSVISRRFAYQEHQ